MSCSIANLPSVTSSFLDFFFLILMIFEVNDGCSFVALIDSFKSLLETSVVVVAVVVSSRRVQKTLTRSISENKRINSWGGQPLGHIIP